jgi:hypothetical protein
MNSHQEMWLNRYMDDVTHAVAKLRSFMVDRKDWVCPSCGNIVGPPPDGFMHEKTCTIARAPDGKWRHYFPLYEYTIDPDTGLSNEWGPEYEDQD